ncbi:hypothetical protein CW749_22830 [Vibrio sp. vnigr-6D03]|uniref:DUF6796 family protein n=1 Tax=Vibrio sp. vnigr-6D03 TaxID=2058088 RepID=UPI000C3282C0|nr:DUF6796 family protein [Vibrio sp. vnigr-6D03]PKF77293.1 hypothetical protein CW749_22830 [Vibrio sp. vnigr-6D03]
MKGSTYLILGMIGAVLMYIGDMLLYFTAEPLSDSPYALLMVMKDVSDTRLILGGLIGPVAAFFYLFGFIGVFLKLDAGKMRNTILAIFSLAIVIGGAYHSQFTNIGMVGKISEEALKQSWDVSVIYMYLVFCMYAIGGILYIYMVLRKQSLLSRKVVLFSPFPLMFVGTALMNVMPQPFMIIIGGGWYNIMMLIFFMSVYVGNKQYVAEQATA